MPTVVTGQLKSPKKPAANKPTICLATPSYGSVFTGTYTTTLFKLMSPKNPPYDLRCFLQFDYAEITYSRNYLLSNFYYNYPHCSHLLFMDDDMGFEPSLLAKMLAAKKDLIGGIYPRRSVNLEKLHSLNHLPYEEALAQASGFVGGKTKTQDTDSANPSVVEATYLGMGATLIARSCIDKMIETLPDLVQPKQVIADHKDIIPNLICAFDKATVNGIDLSEDIAFCYRWRKLCKQKIFAVLDETISHTGKMVVTNTASNMA